MSFAATAVALKMMNRDDKGIDLMPGGRKRVGHRVGAPDGGAVPSRSDAVPDVHLCDPQPQ